MTTGLLRLARISVLALTLGILSVGLSLAQKAPLSVDRLPGQSCTPSMSVAAAQPDLNPLGLNTPEPMPNLPCNPNGCWGMWDEFRKDGEVCRWRNSCDGWQYHGTCPNGFDEHTTEVIPCG